MRLVASLSQEFGLKNFGVPETSPKSFRGLETARLCKGLYSESIELLDDLDAQISLGENGFRQYEDEDYREFLVGLAEALYPIEFHLSKWQQHEPK
jgi:hypothetical protein